MGRLQVVLLTVAGAALTVLAAVAVNQVRDDHGWHPVWAYLALALTCAVSGVAAYIQQPRAPSGRRMPWRPVRVYRRQVRAETLLVDALGVKTRATFVLQDREVYVDLPVRPSPPQDTRADAAAVPQKRDERPPVAGAVRAGLFAEFLEPGKALAVIGGPGTGKTTLVRHQALQMCQKRWWPLDAVKAWRGRGRRPLPVLVYLRDHKDLLLDGRDGEAGPDLARVAVAAGWLDKRIPAVWLERQLERRSMVVVLDGLDEVADEEGRRRVVAWVKRQIQRYPQHTFVVTSRPLGYLSNPLEAAEVLRVQRLTPGQVEAFVRDWYLAILTRERRDPGQRRMPREFGSAIAAAANAEAGKLLAVLADRTALLDMVANPLLLTMIAQVHRYGGELPGTRAALYEEMCEVLLHHRLHARGLADATRLSAEQKMILMGHLAKHMMVAGLRDLPADQAAKVLAKPLRDVQRRGEAVLSAETLLTEICKSGLLAEREHRVYGFAHHSFQEYLTADHLHHRPAEADLLTKHVSEPWWRETTLLWAARHDASGVVRACLTARTIPALSLAFACDEEAGQLDPSLRDQLDHLLAGTPADPAEARLLDGVAADRDLHQTIRLDDDTLLCATPVTQNLWNRYQRHLDATTTPASSPGPTTGMQASDLPGFLTWINSLNPDGPTYRLPTYTELAHRPAVAETAHATFWTHNDHDGYRLYQPTGVPHPHTPTPPQLDAHPLAIIDRLHLLLYLADNPTLPLHQLLLYGHIATHTRPPEYQLVHILDLLNTINTLRGLITARGSAPEAARDRARDLARALARDLNLARDLAVDLDRDFAHLRDLALDHALALARDLDRALARAHAHARALDLNLDLDLDRALALALARDRDRALDLNLDLDRALALARDRALDLDRALALDRDLNLDRALACVLGLALDLARARILARALDIDLDLALDRDLDLDHALDLDLDHAHDLARDRVFARDPARDHDLARDRILGPRPRPRPRPCPRPRPRPRSHPRPRPPPRPRTCPRPRPRPRPRLRPRPWART